MDPASRSSFVCIVRPELVRVYVLAERRPAVRINGFGKHLWALPDPANNTSTFLKILYVYIIFYYSAVVMVKLCM